jgi:hypothetical protein
VRRGRVAYLSLTPLKKRSLRGPEGRIALDVLRLRAVVARWLGAEA